MKKAYNFIDLKNKKFNRLLVLEYLGKSKWLCECDCGNKIIITSRKIRIGHTKNCGCLQKEIAGKIWSETGKKYGYINGKNNIKYKNLIYDDKYKRLKRIYDAMKNRCKNKNNYCGKKNIQICKEWLNNFENFYNWAINNGYSDHLTIDRIDNNGNYEPKNCRWITLEEQQRNKSNNIYITYKNETHCINEWCRILNLSYREVKKLLYQ